VFEVLEGLVGVQQLIAVLTVLILALDVAVEHYRDLAAHLPEIVDDFFGLREVPLALLPSRSLVIVSRIIRTHCLIAIFASPLRFLASSSTTTRSHLALNSTRVILDDNAELINGEGGDQ
jgi:hypothetical protein